MVSASKLCDVGNRLVNSRIKLTELIGLDSIGFINNSFVSGGAIYSLYNDNEPKDIDIFMTSKEALDVVIEHVMKNSTLKMKHGGLKVGTMGRDIRVVVTNRAISINEYQIITKFYGEPQQVMGEFDFHHNMFYESHGVIYKDSEIDWDVLEDNKLVFNENRARDIVSTIMRVPKFLSRGMRVDRHFMPKMLLSLHSSGISEEELELLEDSTKTVSERFGS